MSGTHTQRGKDDSKEMVMCAHCNAKTRKDNLKRHTDNQHPGLQPKWIRIATQTSKVTDFFGRSKVDKEKDIEIEEEEDEELIVGEGDTAKDDETETEIHVTEDSLKRVVSDDVDRENNKKQKTVSDVTLQAVSSADLEEVKNVGLETLDKVNLIHSMLENLAIAKDRGKQVQQSADDDVESQLEIFKMNLNQCKDLAATEDYLQNSGYNNFSEKGFFACKLCYGDSEPASQPAPTTIGIIQYNRFEILSETSVNPQKQARGLLNLKKSVRRHIEETKTHKEKLEEIRRAKIQEADRKLRSHEVGLNIFRLRYYQIKHGLSYLSFEDMVLMAQMNKTDVGDINHSRKFATQIDKNLSEVMKSDFKEALETKLEGTGRLRPLGFAMDKMTPNKQTGQVHAMLTPVPENPLSEHLIVPVMMPVPVVKHGDAIGLANMSKEIFNEAGAKDHQLEGLGWDGQYVKMGVLDKLFEILEKHPEMDLNQLKEWVTQRWEPAHNIELATKDIKELEGVFDWFNSHIKIVNEATEVLKSGKGLQQSIEAAEDLSLKFYKLRSLSTTRFSAYFEKSLSNFEKSIEIIIKALKVRVESKEKKVKDIAVDLLRKIVNKQFLATHLGLTDIYRILGSYSSMLQEVEQFPWEVTEKLEVLVTELRSMSKVELTNTDYSATIANLEEKSWPKLKGGLADVLNDEYIHSMTPLFHEQRRGRSLADIGGKNILKTLENRLTSLCRNLADRIEQRALKNNECPVPEVIKLSGECLDLKKLLRNGTLDEHEQTTEERKLEQDTFNRKTTLKLSKLLKMAGHDDTKVKEMLKEYDEFKVRFFDLIKDDKNELVKKFNHILFEEHTCASDCSKPCKLKNKTAEPKVIRPMKFLHLFLKERDLFTGIEGFLHFFLRCTMKTHAEGVAESMGNLIDIHSDKRRDMGVDNVGLEAQIDWNGPPIHLADRLGEKTFDRIFGGRSKWHFITRDNKKDSVVTRRLKQEKPMIPFFC